MEFKTIEEAFLELKGQKTIVTAMAAAEPQAFFSQLHRLLPENDCEKVVYCANPTEDYPCFTDLSLPLRFVVMFLTSRIRKNQGINIHYCPQHLSSWAGHLIKRHPIDVFWGVCTTPDERGFVSLGPGACYESELRRHASKVILEVNPELPMTFGDTHVHVSKVDAFIEHPRELPTCPRAKPSDVDRKIASYVAELVPNGATIQLGIGSIPNAIGEALSNHKNLGVHTEMINDTMMDLYLGGQVDGSKKSLWPGKIVGAFAYGTKELYQFIDQNPIVELQPASVVNDPYRIGRNFRMHSINTAVEVDITGQVCSESIGHMELSGVGGASETHVGAQRSEGGRGIIAMQSRTRRGDSKIVVSLKEGAKVSISRNDVDTIVTEYGVAELAGRSVLERVQALIKIAHPEHREALESEAKRLAYL
ncbi:MAG: acetyl-CoA hydrolase/transferase C-terminal domain-containing protein [Planctomycetota bacterium]|nr:acetyl-CoA hydrolase/transferase C-terminal domain-containing protein [Planctomycetota bacterium]